MRSTGFGAPDTQNPAFPVEIVDLQAGNFAGAQAIGDKQHEDGTVTFIHRARALNRYQETLDIFALDALWNSFVCHVPRRHDRRSKPGPTPALLFGKTNEKTSA
jgi:hypothetical protein